MTEENTISLDDLSYVKSGSSLSDDEMDTLDGTRVKIETVEIEDGTSKWGTDGKPLPEGQERQVKKLKLTTFEFGEELIGRKVRHYERYNLKEKDGNWIVSLHEKSKTAQFLSKYKIDNFKNATMLENGVVLVKKTNPDTRRSYMTISI